MPHGVVYAYSPFRVFCRLNSANIRPAHLAAGGHPSLVSLNPPSLPPSVYVQKWIKMLRTQSISNSAERGRCVGPSIQREHSTGIKEELKGDK